MWELIDLKLEKVNAQILVMFSFLNLDSLGIGVLIVK